MALTINVPPLPKALDAAADFCKQLAEIYRGQDKAFAAAVESSPKSDPEPVAPVAPVQPAPPAQSEPAAPGPVATPEPPAAEAPQTGSETDRDGLPWDERIHASSRAKVKDGTWRKRKGVNDDYYAQVVAELKGAPQQQPAAPVTPSITPEPSAGSVFHSPQPEQPAAPVPPPGASAPEAPKTFPEFAQKTHQAGFGHEAIQAACAKHGVPSMPLLSTQPDKIPLVWAELNGVAQ